MNREPSHALPALRTATGLLLAIALATAARAQVRFDLGVDARILSSGQPVEINDFAYGDVDGDGDLDLLTAGNAGQSILWRNDGDGVFRISQTFDYGMRCAALVDLDGDGDLDVILGGGRTTYEGPGRSAVYLNDGTGHFTIDQNTPAYQTITWAVTWAICPADFDGDGDIDIVLLTDSGSQYWRNDGGGVFVLATATAFPQGLVADYWDNGRAVDIDGDGHVDLLTSTRLYRNNGAGVLTPVPGWSYTWSEVADIDGDGDPDLIGGGSVLLNDGGLAFHAVGSGATLQSGAWAPLHISVVDIDGDGRLDIVGIVGGQLRLLRNTGGFVFQDVTSTWFAPASLVDRTAGYSFRACIAFDIDGDGAPDVITGGTEGRLTTSDTVGIPPNVFFNSGRTHFVAATRPPFPFVQQTAAALAAGDIDGDGDVDLLFGYLGYEWYNPGPTMLWKQGADGRFTEAGSPFNISLGAAVFVDVDGDGDLDLFGVQGGGPTGFQSGRHHLALNDGAGHFTDVTLTNLPASAASEGSCVVAGDVDGDGDVDLIIGSYLGFSDAPLILLLNDGTGHFTDASGQLPPILVSAHALALADFDGDGDLDLVISNGRYGPAAVPTLLFRNDGTGHFTDVTASCIPANSGYGAYAVDLDGDGDLDIAQSGASLINNGAGVFTLAPGPVGRLMCADFDGDGAQDQVIDTSGSLSIGGAGFAFGWGSGVYTSSVLAVDVDRDGDLDLVGACILGPGNPDWSYVQVGVLYNLHRDLRIVSLPRLGQRYRMSLRAGNGTGPTLAIVAVATAMLTPRLPIPGLGDLALDPAAMSILGFVTVPDADTAVEMTLPIPNLPQFEGMLLASQALFVPVGHESAAHLSNATAETIVR
jgi:hypothetical protein